MKEAIIIKNREEFDIVLKHFLSNGYKHMYTDIDERYTTILENSIKENHTIFFYVTEEDNTMGIYRMDHKKLKKDYTIVYPDRYILESKLINILDNISKIGDE